MDKKAFKAAFPLTMPVFAGYLVLGMGFGILLSSKGYSFLWAFVMSLTIYGGSAQYVAVDLLSGGASLISTALLTFMVNARYLFYGVSMIEKYKHIGKIKPYLIFGLTDETYSLVCTTEPPEGVDRKKFFFYITILDQSYWLLGSVIGAIAGSTIAFNTEGVDFAMTALFVVIFIDQWLSHKDHRPAVIGLISTIICLVIFGAESFLIPAMIVISAALLIMRGTLSKEAM
ncbi:MAG: branched-chain amino acid transporter AzlC [Lachnospiraceae bacterium]|nr:branched-chain amino acid transporter AzlC [Lachnospiraceae bacterium]